MHPAAGAIHVLISLLVHLAKLLLELSAHWASIHTIWALIHICSVIRSVDHFTVHRRWKAHRIRLVYHFAIYVRCWQGLALFGSITSMRSTWVLADTVDTLCTPFNAVLANLFAVAFLLCISACIARHTTCVCKTTGNFVDISMVRFRSRYCFLHLPLLSDCILTLIGNALASSNLRAVRREDDTSIVVHVTVIMQFVHALCGSLGQNI